MKKIISLLFLFIATFTEAQTFSTNDTPVGMEHNLLFNATTRYTVQQTGTAQLNINALFDGRFEPSYTGTGPTTSDPTVILIEGLPGYHIQLGAWVGWSTRYWQTNRFKIEGYDVHLSANTWRIIADYSSQDYTGGRNFVIKIPTPGIYSKLRFTFYSAYGVDGRLGVSELFFIHPEATSPYQGLLSSSNSANQWNSSGSTINYSGGNVGIGTTTPNAKLSVNGQIRATEVKVLPDISVPDYVFEKDYELRTLKETLEYILANKHLPEIPSAAEIKENGIDLGDMNMRLLKKIEELTLYTIQQQKEIEELKQQILK